jgi:DNA repair protein RecN (Recombination protein N)
MLALQALVAEVDEVPTVIFDEVDAGVGGSAAAAVGQKLCVVGARRQVLLVTHLAPIGCLADAHFRIAKDVRRGRTVTSVERLGEADRVQEIARMMAGAQVSAITLSHAEEMLAAGNRWKDQGRPALKPGVPAP